jgi:hypothetical protein
MGSIFLAVFLAFLFGSMLLALSFGYRSIEAERAKRDADEASPRPWAKDGPRFFADLGPAPSDALYALSVRQLEEHLRREHMAVAAFVSRPSVARLYPRDSAHVDAVALEVERYLRDESLKAASFVAAPSTDGLYLDASASIGLSARIESTFTVMPAA